MTRIVQLSTTSETEETGEYFRSRCWELPLDPSRVDEVNRGIRPHMGFRLFYGLKVGPAGSRRETWELLRKGRVNKWDLQQLIFMGFTCIWAVTFVSHRFEIDGKEYYYPENNFDLSPEEITREALR